MGGGYLFQDNRLFFLCLDDTSFTNISMNVLLREGNTSTFNDGVIVIFLLVIYHSYYLGHFLVTAIIIVVVFFNFFF